ncbi:ABC transporter substrate-binding protein [Nocardioides carbamazepini]|uniref:ABC transporter substrate-binding protein n=1 Tax=Nocardioides carbamazepini TaxID=2854259 RepID=UPI00214A7483|nr:ABC transporter substrate-binding protein [Nocardioides carbamazepini]MCR1784989.1 ABC transporter substrate-binding protein [Nocardioides carbamazepini]
MTIKFMQGERIRRALAAAAGAALVTTLAACGGASDEPGAEGVEEISVTVQPASFSAPVFLAIQKGWFEEAGLSVEVKTLPNAGAQMPLIASGDAQFAVAAIVPIVVAASQGLPVKMVAPASLYGSSQETAAVAIIVPGDSDADSAADLEGENVAVIGLKAAPEQLLRNAVEEDGGDPDGVKMVQMDYPTGFSALAKGDVAGMIITEPFVAQAEAQGYKVISYPELDTSPGGLFAAWFSNAKFLSESPDAARRFIEIINRANEYATQNPDEVNDIVAEQMKIDDQAKAALPDTTFATEFDEGSLSATVGDVEKFGWARGTPSVDDLVWTE